MATTGIYKIECNGKVYIGSTLDFRKRRNHHLSRLRSGNHHSIYLQRGFDKYGENSFKIAMLEEMHFPVDYPRTWIDEHLISLEQFYIDIIKPEYNMRTTADARGIPNHTLEVCLKISRSKVGHKCSNDCKQKIAYTKNGGKSINIYSWAGDYIGNVATQQEASLITGVGRSAISNNLSGKSKSTRGYKFIYI